jgi:methylmalonyl-CoA mutase N-terminal domain/subunit
MTDDKKLTNLARKREIWEESTNKSNFANRPEGRDKFMTTSSEVINQLYTPLDVPELDYLNDLGFPGEYPFTRGIHASLYRGRPWTMRMFAGFGTAEETNERYKYLLKQGNMGLSVAFDLPTLMGYDTDSPEAIGEFGKCGVAVSSLRDMEILFEGIPLDQVSTSMTINSPAAIIWAMYIVAAEKQGVPMDALRGTLQNDILKEYIAQKEFIFPPKPSMRLVVDTIEYGTKHLPLWNTISISGYHIREAGSTAAQELAFTLGDGLEYVRWCIDRGLDVDEFAPRLSFFFNCHNDFFEEISKFRAARRIWAREMKETIGAKNPRSWLCRFHTQTAGVSLTAQQPQNNIARVTIQALAAVLGGTQSLHTNSMDEAWALPSAEAATIALRTQQIIAEESGAINTVDPLAGSFFVEHETNKIEQQVYEYWQQVEEMGGVLPAIELGFFQSELSSAAFQYQKEIDNRERVIVGINDYVDPDEDLKIPILNMDPQGYERQLGRLHQMRLERDNELLSQNLSRLRQAAQGTDNTMPYIIDAVRAYATLGEITNVFREVFGEYQEPNWI